jgi:redox-sensitive bicupin YhaK (pirin superfamily)
MGYRSLRVINEDRVDPGGGFPPHDHENMEILSIVLDGQLAHQDSMGNESVVLQANDVQVMSAGTGITHGEYNPSTTKPVHFLQIWIIPNQKDITPRYEKTQLPPSNNQWLLIASNDAREQSFKIHQDVALYAIALDKGKQAEMKLAKDRYGWVQLIDGDVSVNGIELHRGDGAAIEAESLLNMSAKSPARLLFFDLS